MGEEANVVDFVDEALARFYGAAIPGLEAAFTIPYTCPTRKHSRPSIVERGTRRLFASRAEVEETR